MSTREKIKAINNKIKQNKAQYNLDRQTAKSSALSSGNVSTNKFSTCKDVLSEEKLLEKAAAIKRFEYSPLGKELKNTSVAENQYQKFDKVFESNKKEEDKKKKSCAKSNLMYKKYSTFCKNQNTKEFAAKPSFDSK